MKVLLVEDSPVQIEWARRSIGCLCELTVAESEEDRRRLQREEEILILDGCYPLIRGERPIVGIGLKVLREEMVDSQKKISLVTLGSHHDDHNRASEQMIWDIDNFILNEDPSSADPGGGIGVGGGNNNNVLVISDLRIYAYEAFWLEGEGNFIEEEEEREKCYKEGGIPLKPFKRVLEYFSQVPNPKGYIPWD